MVQITRQVVAGWQRRHPWMFAALLLLAVGVVVFWDAPVFQGDEAVFLQHLVDKNDSSSSSSAATASILPPPPYVCSDAQRRGMDGMQFFAHSEECGSSSAAATRKKDFVIPDEGFIFHSRYFTTIYETRVRDVFADVLGGKSSAELASGVVLDVGGNSGWYAAYAATCFGATVHVFEPQEGCLHIMCPLLAKNDIADRVTIHHNIVAATPKTIVLQQGCDPGFSPDHHLETGTARDNTAAKVVTSVSAADVVRPGQTVLLVKIDTEGTEMGVLQSLESLLRDGRITNVVMEIKPASWIKDNRLDANIAEFTRLVYENGFDVYSLEKQVYVTKTEFPNWLVTVGRRADNNFWLKKK